MTEIVITVSGRPWPEGSLRAFVRGGKAVIVHDNPAALEQWRGAVERAARKTGSSFLRRPVTIDMSLYLPRPRSHYRTGRNAHLLREEAPPFPVSRFDSDKLARAVLDSLSGVLYIDDGQVVDLSARKRYAEYGMMPGGIIRVREAL
jgi:Holliday junction resolvase RusA-like endonuclease